MAANRGLGVITQGVYQYTGQSKMIFGIEVVDDVTSKIVRLDPVNNQ